jgi:DNA-directed RNA polymerase subunit RPC12/RpoP
LRGAEKIPITFSGHAVPFDGTALMPSGSKSAIPRFEPVTVGDLVEKGLRISIHCRACGHWSEVDPAGLPLPLSAEIPRLEGAFRCTRCGSRQSCAMPLYPRRLPGQ